MSISSNVNVPSEEVDDRVAARLARRNLFSRDRPARFTFYLHESALRTPVGGRAVMREQLHHLMRMSTRGYLTLRVVPFSRGARRDDRSVPGDGVRRVQASGVSGE